MSPRLIYFSITSALAGFIFGFDTVVISGAEQTIQKLWALSPAKHGMAMSAALWGTVFGALCGSIPTDRLGRKPTLVLVGLLFLGSAIWSAVAIDVEQFAFARALGGVGIGIATVAAPLYISEIAPPRFRGLLAGLFQFNIVFGILMAFVSNALIRNSGVQDDWRWMLGAEALPAAIYMLMAFGLPESPRWLLLNRSPTDARQVLDRLDPAGSEAEHETILRQWQSAQAGNRGVDGAPIRVNLLRPMLLAFAIAMFNQLSGVNAILYFAPRIFEAAGFVDNAALLNTIGLGVTNLIATMVGLWLIDSMGRKTLLLIGSIGYILSLTGISWSFASGQTGWVPGLLFVFIASHAVGQGAVIWVFISEIFPDRFRATGQSVGSGTHWIFAAAVAQVFPIAVARFSQSQIFAFFAAAMVVQLVWVLLAVPETKGVPLEQMQSRLSGRES